MIKKILVCTDFGEGSVLVLSSAVLWSHSLRSQVYLLHVDELSPLIMAMHGYALDVPSTNESENGSFDYEASFNELLKKAAVAPSKVEKRVLTGDAVECAYNLIQQDNIDLLLLGQHKSRFTNLAFLGGFTEKMLQITPVPAIVIREKRPVPPRDIMLACDFTTVNQSAFDWTIDIASIFSAKIQLLHVIRYHFDNYLSECISSSGIMEQYQEENIKGKRKIAEEHLTNMRDKARTLGVECDYKIVEAIDDHLVDKFKKCIQDLEIDLVVLGRSSHVMRKMHAIGNVALKVARNSEKSFVIFPEVNPMTAQGP